jgi:hypothetical protein
MKATLLAEHKDFVPIEADSRGCEGCAFETQLFSDDAESTDCMKVACFEAQFYEGHPLKGTTKPIIWVRKGAP